jgi:dihydrodipicolinate synthase/N-acetylneuraminate lyase
VPLGEVGAVSALADVFPEKVVALHELFSQGKLKEATKIQHELCTLRDIPKKQASPP